MDKQKGSDNIINLYLRREKKNEVNHEVDSLGGSIKGKFQLKGASCGTQSHEMDRSSKRYKYFVGNINGKESEWLQEVTFHARTPRKQVLGSN